MSQDEWMVSYLDYQSRFVLGSRIHHNPTAEHAIRLLEEAIGQFGKPDQILTDRGTQFHPARGGRSEFTEFCSGTASNISSRACGGLRRSVRLRRSIRRTSASHGCFPTMTGSFITGTMSVRIKEFVISILQTYTSMTYVSS